MRKKDHLSLPQPMIRSGCLSERIIFFAFPLKSFCYFIQSNLMKTISLFGQQAIG